MSRIFKEPRINIPKHLQFIRQMPCLASGTWGVDPAHIRFPRPSVGKRHVGGAEKPDDCWVVPLSRAEHDRQHSMQEEAFWMEVGIDPILAAMALFTISSLPIHMDERLHRGHNLCAKITNGDLPYQNGE